MQIEGERSRKEEEKKKRFVTRDAIQRTGTCSFLPSSVRKEMSTRVHALNSQHPPYPELFDPVQPALKKQLNALHSQFVSSHSFLAVSKDVNEVAKKGFNKYLARNGSERSSSATPVDEFHLVPIPCLAPTSTLMRDSSKKTKGSKARAYSCDASTSRDSNEKPIAIDRERHLFKINGLSILGFKRFLQFRKCLSVGSKFWEEENRFLFKSTCEDGSAPFQWSLITDDNAVLPLFDGKITAECRHFDESD
ncbi:hypothetical protein NECAME_14818 [Necator americanus]|uniref:DIX domain-containing protein n=1 Tax=Necator americanus TaxID=51031 RepID=W2SNE7_NECAM|nr:hypothetical protein NECAME_14818 [Necator americanus]ETN70361.1 hypothetical protein NECAME_14818 [Necator americanus]